jgi:microcystin-dependent protein
MEDGPATLTPKSSRDRLGQRVRMRTVTLSATTGDTLALFSLLGTTFGGDGTNDFALPDLRSHAPVSGSNYIIAVEGTFPSRV